MNSKNRLILASLVAAGLVAASPGALANWLWCCDNSQHAGVNAQGRCDNNQITFANKDECLTHKEKHDRSTGHKSKCVGR